MVRPATTKRAETKASKVEDRDYVILTDFGWLVTLHYYYLIEAGNTATL